MYPCHQPDSSHDVTPLAGTAVRYGPPRPSLHRRRRSSALEVWLFGPVRQAEKGSCPFCAEGRLAFRFGCYGRYVQRGEDAKDPRAARATVPMGLDADDITPEVARALLALPRTVGTHPETGKPILAGVGRLSERKPEGATSAA